MDNLKVAILGGGPSAAFCFQACKERRCNVTIFADKLCTGGSAGAFILETVPERISFHEKYLVRILGLGFRRIYSEKQWGFAYPSSFPEIPRTSMIYNPEDIFNDLWRDSDEVFKRSGKLSDEGIAELSKEYDFVFCTFPTKRIRATGFIKQIPVMYDNTPKHERDWKNWVIYDGHKKCPEVRISKLFGHIYTEYPMSWKPDNMTSGTWGWQPEIPPTAKPWPLDQVPAPNVHLIGRYAQLERHFQSNQAYVRATELLLGLTND